MKTLPTIEVFLDTLSASRILAEHQLAEVRVEAVEFDSGASKQLARQLVKQGRLTSWQARRLLAGITQFHVANYVLEEQVAVSKLGRVFLARHQSLERTVAIRVFHRELTHDTATTRRLLEECRHAAALDHRNLVHIYDVGQEHGRVYLVMEYSAAQHLGKHVETSGVLSVEQVLDILIQAADGLGHLHEQGSVHGDVRPENVLLDEDGRVKVVGLGGQTLRERLDDPADTNIVSTADDSPEGANEVGGSLGSYASPEQLNGEQPTTRSDVYSLGCVGYFLLTAETLAQDAADRPPLSQLRPELPRNVTRVITRMMARRPTERYRDATIVREILNDLRDEIEHAPAFGTRDARRNSSHSPTVDRKRNSQQTGDPTETTASNGSKKVLVVALIALLLGAGLATAMLLLWLPPSDSQPVARQDSAASTTPKAGQAGEDSATGADGENATTTEASDDAQDVRLPMVGTPANEAENGGSSVFAELASNEEPGSGDDGKESMPADDEPDDTVAAPKLEEDDNEASPDGAPAKTESHPEADAAKPIEKTPADAAPKKAPPKKKPPKKAPPKQPFRRLASTVALPLPDTGTNVLDIGQVELGPKDLVFARLLGGTQAIKGKESFELEAAQGGLASREWTVFHVRNQNKTPIATFEIVDDRLKFHWDPPAAEVRSAAALINTILTLTSSGKVHKLALRQPIMVEPIKLDLSRSSTTERWRIPSLPDSVIVFGEIAKLSDGLPKAAFDPGQSIPLARKSLRIRLGEKPETSLFFLEVAFKLSRSNVSVTIKPFFQPTLDATPVAITAREIAGLLRQLEAQQQGLVNNIARTKQFQKDLKKARISTTKKKQQSQLAAQQLNLAEQDLQRIANQLTQLNKLNDLQQAIGENASISIRLLAKVGQDKIVLLDTAETADSTP